MISQSPIHSDDEKCLESVSERGGDLELQKNDTRFQNRIGNLYRYRSALWRVAYQFALYRVTSPRLRHFHTA